MQSLLIMTVAFGTFLATLAGGALALRFRDQLHLILGFSAGAIIGLAFFDLLPEALKIGSGDPSKTLSITALGFFGYATLDRLILLHTHHDDGNHTHDMAAVKRGWAGAGSLSGRASRLAWIEVFSSIESASAFAGGSLCRPHTSLQRSSK